MGKLDRVLRFSRQFRSLRTRVHGVDVFGWNSTTTHKLLLLSRFTKFSFCLDFSDKKKPKTEVRSIIEVFLQLSAQIKKLTKQNFQEGK